MTTTIKDVPREQKVMGIFRGVFFSDQLQYIYSKVHYAYLKKHLDFLLIMRVCVFVRDGEDLDSQGEGSSQPDTISLASRTSQNTLDSDKVSLHTYTNTGGHK